MRIINLIVVHCSATREDCTLSPEDLDRLHRRRGFNGTGYHYYIRKDGTVHLTRPLERIGAHAKGFKKAVAITIIKLRQADRQVLPPCPMPIKRAFRAM